MRLPVSRPVKLLRFFLLLTFVVTFNGCMLPRRSNIATRNTPYRDVRVMDYQGHLVAAWVAEGRVWSHGPGYRFRAMERQSGGPFPTRTRYPYGRKVTVNAPNIIVTPRDKPEWLRARDGY
jgi:hypothetical protein